VHALAHDHDHDHNHNHNHTNNNHNHTRAQAPRTRIEGGKERDYLFSLLPMSHIQVHVFLIRINWTAVNANRLLGCF
jgi:ABC-type Zn2+ transport system substrate-binding protein/surface adhesin